MAAPRLQAQSTLSLLAQAVRRAASGTPQADATLPSSPHHSASSSSPQHLSYPPRMAHPYPSYGNGPGVAEAPALLLPDLARLAAAIVDSGHLEAAPNAARCVSTCTFLCACVCVRVCARVHLRG